MGSTPKISVHKIPQSYLSIPLSEYDMEKMMSIAKEEDRSVAKVGTRKIRSGFAFDQIFDCKECHEQLMEILKQHERHKTS
jgi:hypothetical protein